MNTQMHLKTEEARKAEEARTEEARKAFTPPRLARHESLPVVTAGSLTLL